MKYFLLVSHENRIKYFLKEYFSPDYKKKINNGSVILLTIKKKYSNVKMIYEGADTGLHSSSSYFNKDNFPEHTCFTKDLVSCPVSESVSIYIIRHGISEHNITYNPFIIFKKDTSLVTKGKENLKKSIKYLPKRIDYVFSSSLLRTRQTIEVFLEHSKIRDIYIVPSSYQIIFEKFSFNLGPNIPDKKNKKKPDEYTIHWGGVPGKSNMIDEIMCFYSSRGTKK